MALMEEYRGSLRKTSEVSGIYRARVEDNRDPLHIGRVKIRIPMFHGFETDGISTKNLPWASYCAPSGGYQYGTFMVPEIGEYVFVAFEDNNKGKPVYLGSSYGTGASTKKKYGSDTGTGVWYGEEGKNEVPEDAQRDDPTKKILYRSPKGSCISIDEDNDKESIEIEDPKGQKLEMKTLDSGNSRILLEAEGGQKLEMTTSGGDVTIHLDNNGTSLVISSNGVTISSSSSVRISSSQVGVTGNVSVNGNATVYGNVTVVE